MQKKWHLPPELDFKLIQELSEEFKLPPALAAVLIQRGYDSVEKAEHFLRPRLAKLQLPEMIPGISAAVERLEQALQKKEKIILYGDYDVDGITSLAFLTRLLRALGGDVGCFIPERAGEGYGLSKKGLERCFETFQPELIVAVDCGTNSFEEAKFIRTKKSDLIVIDHHEIQHQNQLPPILVNPQLSSDFHYLCSVGLVFKCAHALLRRYPKPPVDLREYLDLVALGTVADIVPLVEENRILVSRGLQQLSHSRWPGVQALIKVAEVQAPFTAFDIGYKLGPRLNAAGRLSSALEALDLLLTDDPVEALRLAEHLDRRNRERQAIERLVTREAEELAAELMKTNAPKSIILGRSHWHHGVVGIVASRISKRWHRPTFIIGFDEAGLGKGSGRSISGFSLVAALEKCAPCLETFGGHAMAAGLTVKQASLETLAKTFEQAAAALLADEQLIPTLELNAELDLTKIDFSWLSAQDELAPFGIANAQPLFFARAQRTLREPRVLQEKHLRLEFAGAKNISAIFFNGALEPLPEQPWDLAFTIERNTYQGRTSLQLQVVALREAAEL